MDNEGVHSIRFIRWLKPRRLREALAKDVTERLRLLAGQPDTAVLKLRQADKALRILMQEMLGMSWEVPWPVGVFGDPEPGWLRENANEQKRGNDGQPMVEQWEVRNAEIGIRRRAVKVASKVATMDCLWNDAVPEAGAPMVGSNAGWNEGVCARRLRN